jgi:hypothetical protein
MASFTCRKNILYNTQLNNDYTTNNYIFRCKVFHKHFVEGHRGIKAPSCDVFMANRSTKRLIRWKLFFFIQDKMNKLGVNLYKFITKVEQSTFERHALICQPDRVSVYTYISRKICGLSTPYCKNTHLPYFFFFLHKPLWTGLFLGLLLKKIIDWPHSYYSYTCSRFYYWYTFAMNFQCDLHYFSYLY